MPKFPIDAPKNKVIKALEVLGFQIVREREHIAMLRENSDGKKTPLTMPNMRSLRVRTQAGITREEFLRAYHRK